MLNVILTAVLVVITGFYAWATYKILRANERVVEVMREQAEGMTRPYVTAAALMEPDIPMFYLRIFNTGKTAAIDLKLTLDRPFYPLAGKDNLSDYAAFKDTITSFAPGAEIVILLGQFWVIFGDKADSKITPSCFNITAEYSYAGKQVKEVNTIDFRPYLGTNQPLNAYVRKLKEINESIQGVAKRLEKES